MKQRSDSRLARVSAFHHFENEPAVIQQPHIVEYEASSPVLCQVSTTKQNGDRTSFCRFSQYWIVYDLVMASSSISGTSNPFGAIERTGGSGAVPKSLKANVDSESRATEKKSEEREHFSASESFYQRMETMINKEDVQSILEKQKET